MKVGKAAGPDGVPVEVWKSLGELGLQWLTTFSNNITWSARISQAWRDSIIVPIFKRKGDVMDCTNYRGIKLIAHTMKIYERFVDMRLRGVVEIAPDQFDFIPERSAIDAIFIARQVMGNTVKRISRVILHFLIWKRRMIGYQDQYFGK
ncbi:hypothetical protein Y032_0047g1503 [Ancylostoma ceylanicum]|uniref:Reverse transcriptase domain-containing protein n=1 Tax=Ancylostoma ceylanicum TaxID=53326 RepID=A0A016UD07_9BILA|nr:hypothetical protein Y032_0047g1503 [Ancylostoma ceylanicum]